MDESLCLKSFRWFGAPASDFKTLLGALKACSRLRDSETGRKVHTALLRSGDELNVFLGSRLVDMYGKCGRMVIAQVVFDSLEYRDVVLWSVLILGYAENKEEADLALKLFADMQTTGCAPDYRTLLAVLKACSRLAAREEEKALKLTWLLKGRAIHHQAAEKTNRLDVFLGNTLIEMYSSCGSMVDAWAVFDKMKNRDVSTWNELIRGYIDNGEGDIGLKVFHSMHAGISLPNRGSFVAAVKACTCLALREEGTEVAAGKVLKVASLRKGMAVHQKVRASGFQSDIFVANALIDMYGKCGCMAEASKVFQAISQQHKDVISWTSLVHGYAENGEPDVALKLFERMLAEKTCPPNSLTYVGAFKACANSAVLSKETSSERNLNLLETGMAIHSHATEHRYDEFTSLGNYFANSLMDMYAKCGAVEEAWRIFDRFPGRNVVSWTAMILGYADNGQGDAALRLFSSMQGEGCIPNTLTYVAAVKACSNLAEKEQGKDIQGQLVKLKSLERGMSIHSSTAKCFDSVLANTMINFYANCASLVDAKFVFDDNGKASTALEVFTRSLASQEANSRMFVAAVKSCALVAEGEQGKEVQGKVVKLALEKRMTIHREILNRRFESYTFLANTLVDMYGKCGDMLSARRVFERLERRDVVSWTVLISGYAENSEGEEALQLMERMNREGFQRRLQTRTFLLAALKACSSVGVLEKGREVHADVRSMKMENDLGVATALVDFYAKGGSMTEAQAVFDSVRGKDVVIWNTLLAGYSRQGDTQLVFTLFDEMVSAQMKPDGVTLLSLLVTCAHAGLVEKGAEHFDMMEWKYQVKRGIEHYHCMVDMFGRANQLERAVETVRNMPYTATSVSWMIVLSACCKWKNVELAEIVFKEMVELDREQPAARILMSNLYGSAGLWLKKSNIRTAH